MFNWIIGIPLLTLFASIALAIRVMPSTRREPGRATLNLLLLLIVIWTFCSVMFRSTISPSSIFWIYSILVCGLFTGAVGVHFSAQFTKQTGAIVKWLVAICYILNSLMLVPLLLGKIIEEAALLPNGIVEVKFGSMAPFLWGIIGLGISVALAILISTFIKSSYPEKKYTIFPVIGFIVMAFGAMSNMVISSYPVDIAANFIFISFISYGVVGTHMIRPAHVQPLRLTIPVIALILVLCYAAVVVFCLKWLGTTTGASHLIAAITVIIFGSITFNPSRMFFSNKLKLIFFPNVYHYQKALSDLASIDRSLPQWTNSVSNILNIIAKSTSADNAILLVRDSKTKDFQAQYAVGLDPASLLRLRLPDDSPLVKTLAEGSDALIIEDIERQTTSKVLLHSKDDTLQETSPTLCCGVQGYDGLLAIVALTCKSPHVWDRTEDKDFLKLACSQIAPLIINANLYQASQLEIEERKQAEMALRESEERYRSLLNLGGKIGEAIIMLQDTEKGTGIHAFVSEEWARLTGYSEEELLGMSMLDLIHPRDRDAALERHKMRMQGKSIPELIEITIIRKDGIEVPVEVTGAFTTYKGKRASVIYIRDITERKRADEAFYKSERQASAAIEAARALTFNYDIATGKIEWGGVIEKITGYTKEEFAKIDVDGWAEKIHPDDRDEVLSILQEAMGKDRATAEYRFETKTGYITLSSISITERWGGKAVRLVGILQDITERKQIEEERTKYAKLESVGTLAGGIAHDFNNILTGIMGNISLAKRYIEPKGKAEERLMEAEKASIRARDLTQQLLTFSRGGAPVKSIVSIAGLLKESIGFALRGSNLRCDFDLPDNLWPVEVDEGQINQVITNIVINAQEAMPEGGVINITAGNTEIKERSTLPLSKGRYVLITIADQGVGIRKKHLDRIFDPYFTTKQKGSGLGLATSYSVIKNHGGYITVDSAPVVGTAFQIYLPASKKSVAVEKETKDEVITSGEGRILVMDDEEMVRDLLYAELTEVGYNVELASDGAEAIEQYAKAKESGEPFDAVIMDLTIPGGMGGKEAIKKLLKINPQAKAIVSSGYATDPIMSEYKKYGFSAVVAKPYSVAQIEKTLHGLLGKKK